jgi:hypothetical protein
MSAVKWCLDSNQPISTSVSALPNVDEVSEDGHMPITRKNWFIILTTPSRAKHVLGTHQCPHAWVVPQHGRPELIQRYRLCRSGRLQILQIRANLIRWDIIQSRLERSVRLGERHQPELECACGLLQVLRGEGGRFLIQRMREGWGERALLFATVFEPGEPAATEG